jgi:hypothetical protein
MFREQHFASKSDVRAMKQGAMRAKRSERR